MERLGLIGRDAGEHEHFPYVGDSVDILRYSAPILMRSLSLTSI